MGRPRKRRREDDLNDEPGEGSGGSNGLTSLPPPGSGNPVAEWADPVLFDVGVSNDAPASYEPNLNSPRFNQYAAITSTGYGSSQTSGFDQATSPYTPSPATNQQSALPCSCLPNMYLATSSMTSPSPPNVSFPAALVPVRAALNTAADMLACSHCISEFESFRHNFLLVNTLLSTILSRIRRVFAELETETTRAKANGEKKKFRMGEFSPETMHLHTGTPDCPMGFDVELEAGEWRSMLYRTVKGYIYEKGDGRRTLEGLIGELEARQMSMHAAHAAHRQGVAEIHAEHEKIAQEGDFTCVRLIKELRRMVACLPA